VPLAACPTALPLPLQHTTKLGDKATFSWSYTGLDTGRNNCTIEGGSSVALAGPCSSPLIYTVRTTLNQTLTVSYQDVCRARHNASLTFGPGFGWEVEAKELGTTSLSHHVTSTGGAAALLTRNAAGASVRSPVCWWLVLAAAALGLLL
jgi:hypothetical protein